MVRKAFARAKITNPLHVVQDGEQAINYLAGTSKVVFAVALNGWGWGNTVGGNVGFGDFVPADVGNALFFGPFTKVSNAFTFGRSVQPQTQTQILKFKVSDFVRPQ